MKTTTKESKKFRCELNIRIFPHLVSKVSVSNQEMRLPKKDRSLPKWVGFSNDTASAQHLSDYKILELMELRKFIAAQIFKFHFIFSYCSLPRTGLPLP